MKKKKSRQRTAQIESNRENRGRKKVHTTGMITHAMSTPVRVYNKLAIVGEKPEGERLGRESERLRENS